MKQSKTLRRRVLSLAIMSLVAIATIVMPASPASAAVNKNGVLYADGARAGSYNGDMHYSALAQESYNEFCIGNPDPNDGYTVVAYSTIYNSDNGELVNYDRAEYGVTDDLGCFKHAFAVPAGTDEIRTHLYVCLVPRENQTDRCASESKTWRLGRAAIGA